MLMKRSISAKGEGQAPRPEISNMVAQLLSVLVSPLGASAWLDTESVIKK